MHVLIDEVGEYPYFCIKVSTSLVQPQMMKQANDSWEEKSTLIRSFENSASHNTTTQCCQRSFFVILYGACCGTEFFLTGRTLINLSMFTNSHQRVFCLILVKGAHSGPVVLSATNVF